MRGNDMLERSPRAYRASYRKQGSSGDRSNKKAQLIQLGFSVAWVPDNDLLSRAQCALSSACCRFTVLFEMGRCGSGRLWSSGVEGAPPCSASHGRQGFGLARIESSARLWDQAARAISTGQLNALPRFHFRPINVVVCHDPSGRSSLREISSSGTFPA